MIASISSDNSRGLSLKAPACQHVLSCPVLDASETFSVLPRHEQRTFPAGDNRKEITTTSAGPTRQKTTCDWHPGAPTTLPRSPQLLISSGAVVLPAAPRRQARMIDRTVLRRSASSTIFRSIKVASARTELGALADLAGPLRGNHFWWSAGPASVSSSGSRG